jgi:hypothetical protein
VKSAALAFCLMALLATGVAHKRTRQMGPPEAPSAPGPELPRTWVDTTMRPTSGRTLAVPAGGDLQAALDAAQPGDVVTLEAGATFRGPFTLRLKPGHEWITIRTSASDAALPPPGTRVAPAHAALMPKLEAGSGSVITTAPGAHHYRLIGLEIKPSNGVFLYNLVLLGGDETTAERLPHHVIFDRCYLHGDPRKGTRRGIALNASFAGVVDSYLADFKEAGADSQALAGWNGPGPFAIVNNHLEGAGENLIFGGGTPAVHNLVPSDIEIRFNHFFKPLVWRAGEPGYEGTAWTVKNLLELKNARRVLVEGNLLENNWPQAQNGFAILLTVRTELDTAPWAVVEDVTFRSNVLRRAAAGVNILGIDDSSPGGNGRTRDILFAGNLFEDIGVPGWGGSGALFQVLNGATGIVIDHNTALQRGSIIAADMAPSPGLVFSNNITPHNEYGVFGSGSGSGLNAIAYYFPGSVFTRNVIVGAPRGVRYPPDNFFPESLEVVGCVDLTGRDYRLSPSSQFLHAGTDGLNIGADINALSAALQAAQGQTPEWGATQRPGESRPRKVRP